MGMSGIATNWNDYRIEATYENEGWGCVRSNILVRKLDTIIGLKVLHFAHDVGNVWFG